MLVGEGTRAMMQGWELGGEDWKVESSVRRRLVGPRDVEAGDVVDIVSVLVTESGCRRPMGAFGDVR
jgi:hypothetical protein